MREVDNLLSDYHMESKSDPKGIRCEIRNRRF